MANEEIIARLYVNSFTQLRDSSLEIIEFYNKQSTILLEQLYELKDQEPCKIFKKAHKKWQDSVESLQLKYDSSFEKYLEECMELEKLMKLAKIK